ncbi:putative protein kinase [Leptomonas pyrrhocoris]|uniref:PH domain-containing protein n=1 Tax=Leptomonas pyrrhocoris TaxID=157538 RepID=A0A0M9FXP0_LEPPY|nr:putative protein kinase [Leptomonas pyrrhocoris]KPA78067.1 putative protein kinase [Leptomonas pyrrhocoris]|eukprot:XP_015656506.1 putative protein kinase [Leptomonas pyrrhocoris]
MSVPVSSSLMVEREEAYPSERGPRQDPPPPPPRAAWMWKPRSTLVDSDGNAKRATSLMQLRRIGAKQWNRRFVFLDHHLFCYGKDKGSKDKEIPFELIVAVRRETADKLRREHAPKEFADFGWNLAVKGRTLLFCAESEERAEQWVNYLAALLRAMKGNPTGPLSGVPPSSIATPALAPTALSDASPEILTPERGTTLAELGAQYDNAHPNDGTHDTLTTVTSPVQLLSDEVRILTPGESSRQQQTSLNANPQAQPSTLALVPTGEVAEPQKADEQGQVSEAALDVRSEQGDNRRRAGAVLMERTTTLGGRENAKTGDNAGEDAKEEGDAGGNEANSDLPSDASLLDVSSDDTEGEDNGDDDREEGGGGDDDGDGEVHPRTRVTGRSISTSAFIEGEPLPEQSATERQPPREMRYARFLLPLAADPHSHIAYRIPALEAYFKSGDDVSSVTFSRTMEKVGKRDNAQTREVVLTPRHLYLFSKGRLANGQKVRCIDTHDITGVVESTTDKTLIAVLIPASHDVLLRVVAQNSCVPGTPVEVKQQLIAHLYKAHYDAHTDHRFLFWESATVAKRIRRTEEANFPPLVVRAGDQMRVGEKPTLLETFAKNADEAVYWSSMVRQVLADRTPRLCALVVTESSIYSLSDTLQEVVRRAFMRDLLHVEYDRDAQSILLQCRGVDMLFNMQSSAEFDGFLRVLPAAMADGFGRTPRLTPSKQLYSHAKLFGLSTLKSAGSVGATRSAARRRRGFPWTKGMKGGGGARLLSSFAAAAAAADEEGETDEGVAAAAAFRHSIQGDYGNSQAIRRFCAQFRFVEEVLLDYDDAVALWRQYEASAGLPWWDTLRLRSTFTTRLRVGEICLTAACRLLEAKECATLAKSSALELHESVVKGMGTPRAICVTSEGFLFLSNGVASAATAPTAEGPGSGSADTTSTAVRSRMKRRLSGAVSHTSSSGAEAGKDDGLILGLVGWSSIAAVVRCHSKEGSSVALLTNRTHPVDYLFHLASAQTMLDVMAAAMGCYAQYRHGGSDHTHLLPLYAAPRVQNLAVALKKSIFDPFPTVALRYTPYSFPSDRLRMAVVPDVADACRRFGDNTIYFSGVAWRVRSATLRKYGGHLAEDPGAAMRRQNNHLYKSYIFVLTNVAIYHCTKGGFEVVRRTLLTDIKGITVGQRDPDTVLLTVPSEYDMYFRVAGRGPEVVARLQEAYLEWTNYGHYLPHERQGSHALEEYSLPVRQAPCVVELGALTKPAYFNDLQNSRPAAECRNQTLQWHLRCLRRAIASFERAQAAARKEHRSAPAAAAGAPPWWTWRRMRAALEERQSFLYFVHRRCFRFGLTGEDFNEMQRAQRLLRSYREMESSAMDLVAAMSGSDPEAFRAALQRASAVPDLRLLVEEETRVYEGHLARRACLTAVFAAVQRYRYQPNGRSTSLVALEAAVLDLLDEARRVRFDASFLRYLVRVVRVLVQRTQLQRLVCDPANRQRLSIMRDGGWVLVQQAAGEVGMTWRPPVNTAAAPSPSARLQLNVRVAQLALKRSIMTDDPILIRGAVALAVSVLEACAKAGTPPDAKEGDAATATTLRRTLAAVQDAYTQINEEERQHLARAVAALIAARQTHQRQQTWTPRVVSDMLTTCMELEEQVAAQPFPLLHKCTQSLLAMEHAMLTEQQHRLQQRQALENRELDAQQQHERELQRRQLAMQRAGARQQRREATAQERRQRKALAQWSSQVDQLASQLTAVLDDAEEVADESIRLGVKHCVHLQRLIVEAGARYGLSAPTSAASAQRTAPLRFSPLHQSSTSPGPMVRAGDKALAELLAKLQSVAARAQHLLDNRARGGADPYGMYNTSRSNTAVHPSPTGAFDGDAEAGAGGVAPALSAEVEQLIAALDTNGVVAYIHQHQDHTSTPDVLEQIRIQWQRARRHQRWVEALHRRLHAAAVLHSRELLEAALQESAAAAYTDAAVETACRAVAAMTNPPSQRQHRDKRRSTSNPDAIASPTTSSPLSPSSSPALDFVAPWRRRRPLPPTEGARDAKTELDAATASSALRPTQEEKPITKVDVVDGLHEDRRPILNAVGSTSEAAQCVPLVNQKLDEVTQAMEGVARAAETAPDALPNAKAVLQQLYAATVALVDRAASATSDPLPVTPSSTSEVAGSTAAAAAICVTADNPFCASFLRAWRAVLQHQARPSGVVIKAPRTVWDVVRGIGETNTDGDYAAPYVARLSSDFQRLYRSTEDSDAARHRTDAVLLALIFFSHRMACVWEGLEQLGEKDRRALLLPDSLMAQPAVVRALLAAARVCDAVQWQFSSVQALATECLFPRNGAVEVPVPRRFLESVASVADGGAVQSNRAQHAGSMKATLLRTVAPPPEIGPAQPPPSVSTSQARVRPRNAAVSSSALETPAVEVEGTSVGIMREAYCGHALSGLKEAVRDIASYFTRQLRTHGPAPGASQTTALYFDEHRYPEVGTLVETSVLPPLAALLTCGLVRRYQLVRTRTLWDVLTELRETLTASGRTLAAAEVLSIMLVVEALTGTPEVHGRSNAKLRALSDEELDSLRVRVFLRECLNRRQLYPLVSALFPPLSGNEAWVAEGSGVLWTLYNPALCLLYPPDAESSMQLRPLLEKLSALPFVLIPDRELR